MADFKLTPAREKELEKIAKDLPDKSFKDKYGKDWKSVKIATAMNMLKKKYGFKEETKMKFKQLREKMRSKMSGSKLTGQEVSVYYRKNPSAKKAARDPKVKKAIEFALDHGGAMNFAIKNIEKMKRGLSNHPEVAKALEFANFGEDVVKEALVKEGTWRVPQNKNELTMMVDMLAKPYPATKPTDIDKFLDSFPVGDDSLYDDLEQYMYERETDPASDGEAAAQGLPFKLKRPLKKVNKFPKVFLNVIAGKSLEDEKWIKGKTQGNKYIATAHYFGPLENLDLPSRPKAKRKSGNIRKTKMVKL